MYAESGGASIGDVLLDWPNEVKERLNQRTKSAIHQAKRNFTQREEESVQT